MHATIPNGTVGAFEVTLLQRILKLAREAMDVCLQVLKEIKKAGSTATVSGTVY